jgi:flagellar biosynthetic protein FlhB
MADKSDEEKTLDPTEQKKQEFREQGKIPKSQEILGAAGLLVGFGSLLAFSSTMAGELMMLASDCWRWTSISAQEELYAPEAGRKVMLAILAILSGPLAAMWLGSLVVGMLQSRFIIPKDPLKFDMNRINPLENAKQKFLSSQPFVELAKGITKIVAIGAVIWMAALPKIEDLPALTYAPAAVIPLAMWDFGLLVLIRSMPIAIIIAMADYAYQSWKLNDEMKMSRQDMKDEQKKSEGDPHFKAARRQRQIEISRRAAAVQSVPQADVIITNPTHFAIALRYRDGESPAPVVLARGVDHLALKMQAVARKHDIPRVENRPLARALYAQCKEGQVIPEELYGAVAEVLAIIYRRRGRRRK